MTSPRTFQNSPWKLATAIFFLLLYGMGAIEVAGIHEAFHAEDHTEALEKDPCHRSLFHQAQDSCEHPTHFTAQKKCYLCHLIFQNDESATEVDAASSSLLIKSDFRADAPTSVCSHPIVRCGRAPPVQA